MYKIVKKENLNPTVTLMEIEAPFVARKAEPGQFIILRVDEDGFVKSVTCLKQELGEPDASGRRSPRPVAGSEFDIEADCVIMSIGTSPNPLIKSTTPGLESNRHGCLVADEETGKTTKEHVYAGGDAVTGAATVILAMGAGKAAAKAIDEELR